MTTTLEATLEAQQETRWYVALGALPIKVQAELFSDGSGIVGNSWSAPANRLFETEREALDYALKHKREAKETAEREYDEIVKQLDKMEKREAAKEF